MADPLFKATADYSAVKKELDKAIAQIDKLETRMKKLTATSKKGTAEEKARAREVKRTYEECRTPQEKYKARILELNQLVKKSGMTWETHGRASKKALRELQQSATSATSKVDQITGSAKMLAGAAGLGSVLAVTGKIRQAYQTWRDLTHEIGAETKKAADEIVAFAALQEGGTKAERVQQAAALGREYGVTERGEAFNTVQALQSVRGGDFAAGMKSAKTVFAASQLGIPVERGRELEVLGTTQGQASGDMIRRAYVAGQMSGRDPETLAGAAAGMKFWQDKDFGFAAAGVLSGTIPEAQLPVYLKRAGTAMSKVGPVQEKFAGMGMGDATQAERLQKMYAMGLRTPEDVYKFGITEKREGEAIAGILPNMPEVMRVYAGVQARAKPGLFARERGQVESELPMTKVERQRKQAEAGFRDELAFGPRSLGAAKINLQEQQMGLAMTQAGRTQTALTGARITDEEGRAAHGKVGLAAGEEVVSSMLKAWTPFSIVDQAQKFAEAKTWADRAYAMGSIGPGGMFTAAMGAATDFTADMPGAANQRGQAGGGEANPISTDQADQMIDELRSIKERIPAVAAGEPRHSE